MQVKIHHVAMEEEIASKSCKEYDHDEIIGNILLDLREDFNCTTAVTCCASEKSELYFVVKT